MIVACLLFLFLIIMKLSLKKDDIYPLKFQNGIFDYINAKQMLCRANVLNRSMAMPFEIRIKFFG